MAHLPAVNDQTFETGFPPQPLDPVQRHVFRLLRTSADFDGVKDNRLRLRFEFQPPLRLVLHRLHGFQPHRSVDMCLAEFGMNLLIGEQVSDWPANLRLKSRIKRAWGYPVRNGANLHAVPGYR